MLTAPWKLVHLHNLCSIGWFGVSIGYWGFPVWSNCREVQRGGGNLPILFVSVYNLFTVFWISQHSTEISIRKGNVIDILKFVVFKLGFLYYIGYAEAHCTMGSARSKCGTLGIPTQFYTNQHNYVHIL